MAESTIRLSASRPLGSALLRSLTSPAVARVPLGVAFVVGWQLASGRLIRTFWVSSPSRIADKLYTWGSTGVLWSSLGTTMTELALGGLIGVAVGTVAAIALGTMARVSGVLNPLVNVAYAFPQLTLAPLYVVWFGFYSKPKVILVAVVVFFVIFYNVLEGVRRSSPQLVDAVRIMGGGRLHTFRLVIWPTSVYYLATGLRHAIPYGLRAVVFGEILAATSGIGWLIGQGFQFYDSTAVFAGLVVLIIIGVSLNSLLELQQRRFKDWSFG